MDLATLKTIGEIAGAVLTSLSIVLMGRTGRVQVAGVCLGLAAIVPWVMFAVVTSSWLIIVQSAVALAANAVNLRDLLRKRRDAA